VVAYNMSEWRSFLKILRAPRSDVAIMGVTFILTVAVNLTVALQIGVILSAMLFIRRMSEVSQVTQISRELKMGEDEQDSRPREIPEGVEVFEVFGSLFFGAVDQFTETIRTLQKKPKVFILETRSLLSIDAAGLRALEDLLEEMTRQGTRFIVCGIHKQPLFALTQSGLIDRIGEKNLCGSLSEALRNAGAMMSVEISSDTAAG